MFRHMRGDDGVAFSAVWKDATRRSKPVKQVVLQWLRLQCNWNTGPDSPSLGGMALRLAKTPGEMLTI